MNDDSDRQNGQRILLIIWGLFLMSLITGASLLGQTYALLEEGRRERHQHTHFQQEIIHLSGMLHRLSNTSGTHFRAMLEQPWDEEASKEWLSPFQEELDREIIHFSDNQGAFQQKSISEIRDRLHALTGLWQKALLWREGFLPLGRQVHDKARILKLRQELATVREELEERRNHLPDFPATVMPGKKPGMEALPLSSAENALAKLGVILEQVIFVENSSQLATIEEKELIPALTCVAHNLEPFLAGNPPMTKIWDRFQQWRRLLLGEGFQVDQENNLILPDGKSFLSQKRAFLAKLEEKEALYTSLTEIESAFTTAFAHFTSAMEATSQENALKMERHFGGAHQRNLTLGILFALLLLVVALLASRLTRRQILAIVQSRHRLRSIVDSAADAILTVNEAGVIQSANATATAIFGHPPHLLIGQLARELAADLPNNRERLSLFSRHFETLNGPVRWEMEGLRASGATFPMEVAVSQIQPLSDHPSNLSEQSSYTLLIRDITISREAELTDYRSLVSRLTVTALLETSLEHLSLTRQLEVSLEIILTIPWLAIHSKGAIFLWDNEREELVMAAQKGLNAHLLTACARVKPGYCLCGRAAQSSEIVFASDLDHRHDITYTGISQHGHYCIPIRRKEELIGVLNLYLPQGFVQKQEEDAFLTTIAYTLAGVIQHRRLEEELHRQQAFVSAVLETVGALVVVLDPHGRVVLFNRTCQEITGFTQSESVGRPIWELLIPEEEVEGVKEVFQHLSKGQYPSRYENHLITRHGQHRLIAWANTVLTHADGSVRHIIGTGLDITERRAAEEQLRFLAHHDPLTRLPNRILFLEHLERALARAKREKNTLAVLFMDLDRFKNINDTLGHEVGDMLLVETTRRIQQCLRQSDTVARMGGDEFTLLLPTISGEEDACHVARKIIEEVSSPYILRNNTCQIGASIGISIYPTHADAPELLLNQADIAMYHVKQHGRNHFLIFQQGMSLENGDR